MSPSFGFNRAHEERDYENPDELLFSFIDTVSKNGNLLLNVGPRGEDASIPLPQTERLEMMGKWLDCNGEAIYGTRPWQRAEGETIDGIPIRFTTSGNDLYVILLGTPTSSAFVVRDLGFEPAAVVTYFGNGATVSCSHHEGGLEIDIGLGREDTSWSSMSAHAFRISPAPSPATRE
jgi:alpha-L-fucosidase